MYIRIISYGIYMIWMRLRGFKRYFIEKTRGEEEAWRYGQKVFLKWSRFTIKTLQMEIEVIGAQNIPKGTCVFMGNHQSILDIPVIRATVGRTVDFVAKEELLKVPVIGYWIAHLKSVSLDRNNVREGLKAMNTAIERISNGYNFVIFPEGTRSKDGRINSFKKGSVKIATKSRTPIVPFAINGTASCFEENKKFKSGKVKIIFGRQIDTNNLSKEEEKSLVDKLYSEVYNMYEEIC
ncbi:lysophospholipid acyltransferase family protein [Clostridium cibarium]|nr:lysophospholipid acyltransferase family protein [Clostridium cibarium]